MSGDFGGDTYDPDLDRDRLRAQLQRVLWLMKDGEWRTLFEIRGVTGDPTQSVSARLRDFRKEKFGGHTVNRRRRGDGTRGLFEYQLILHLNRKEDPMTIELSTKDMTEILEQAARYGACVLKTKTTDGDDAWIAVQSSRAGAKRGPRAANAAEQITQAPQPANATITQ